MLTEQWSRPSSIAAEDIQLEVEWGRISKGDYLLVSVCFFIPTLLIPGTIFVSLLMVLNQRGLILLLNLILIGFAGSFPFLMAYLQFQNEVRSQLFYQLVADEKNLWIRRCLFVLGGRWSVGGWRAISLAEIRSIHLCHHWERKGKMRFTLNDGTHVSIANFELGEFGIRDTDQLVLDDARVLGLKIEMNAFKLNPGAGDSLNPLNISFVKKLISLVLESVDEVRGEQFVRSLKHYCGVPTRQGA